MNLKVRLLLSIWRFVDSGRHSVFLRNLNAIRLFVASCVALDHIRSAERLSCSLGFSESLWLGETIRSALKRRFPPEGNSDLWLKVAANLPRYRKLLDDEPSLTRSIILKAPLADGEKGILLMYFEYNWARSACGLLDAEFDWIDQHYDVILSTSWSPTDYAILALFLARTSSPIFVQPCNYEEKNKLSDFHRRIEVLETLPCDWINPDNYGTNVGGRPIDFLMVANWGEFKRHWDFFMALRKLPTDLRVVLVGQKEGGRDAGFIRSLAAEIGVPQTLEIHQSLPIQEVAALQSQAKVSVIFSRREGCCVAAVESLFAGCALGMRADARVGPLDYINERTGLRLRPSYLAEDLQKLLDISSTLDPAGWARENVSCFITHEKLNRQLADSARARGLPWTRDLVIPHWRPYPKYVHPEDAEAMRPVYNDLHARFPKVFPEFETLFPD